MALNIPVNLMNVLSTTTQPTQNNEMATVASVQPAKAGEGTQNAASHGNSGDSADRGGTAQFAAMLKKSSMASRTPLPDRAEPRSIVTAQGNPSEQTEDQSVPAPAAEVEDISSHRMSELDRYAPPDPLPTAPILRAATSYAAQNKLE